MWTSAWESQKCLRADLYEEKLAKLGPDPLREDADRERLWEVMQKSKKSIGQLLMDQSAVAGIGNIYRAEILFKVQYLLSCGPSALISR